MILGETRRARGNEDHDRIRRSGFGYYDTRYFEDVDHVFTAAVFERLLRDKVGLVSMPDRTAARVRRWWSPRTPRAFVTL